jgi:hypothetical protein
MNWSLMMVDRHWFGDLGWAVLLALPLAVFASSPPLAGPSAAPTKAAVSHQDSSRFSLLG